jgi:phytoene synthase
MQSTAAIAECFQRVAPAGSDLYYATLWCDTQTRAQIVSVHALIDELISIARARSDPGVARIKLAWWKEELARVLAGAGNHSVSIALRATGALGMAEPEISPDIADICAAWLMPRRFPDLASLYAEFRNLEGALWRHTAGLLGATDKGMLDAAATAGVAIGLIQTLQQFRESIHLPTLRLPEDILAARGLTVDSLREAATPTAIAAMANDLATQIRSLVGDTQSALLIAGQRQLLPLRIMLELKLKALDEMQMDGFALMQRRIELTPLRKLWIAMLCRHRDRWRWNSRP